MIDLPTFTVEDKGRKLVCRAELGRTVGDQHIVTRIEMGVRFPGDEAGRRAALAELTRQVRDVFLSAAFGVEIPRHLTDQRHRDRRIASPQVAPEVLAELQREG